MEVCRCNKKLGSSRPCAKFTSISIIHSHQQKLQCFIPVKHKCVFCLQITCHLCKSSPYCSHTGNVAIKRSTPAKTLQRCNHYKSPVWSHKCSTSSVQGYVPCTGNIEGEYASSIQHCTQRRKDLLHTMLSPHTSQKYSYVRCLQSLAHSSKSNSSK